MPTRVGRLGFGPRLRALLFVASACVVAAGALPAMADPNAASLPPGRATVTPNSHHDTSPPLRSMHDSGTRGTAHPALRGPASPAGPAAPDTSNMSATPLIPSTSANFEGIGANGSAPPDNDGAAGTTQFVELVNQEIEVFSKTGGVLKAAANTNTLWSGFGGDCQTHNDGDGTVLWDTLAQRWFVQQFSVDQTTPAYNDCVAVSTTSDATGTWNRYSFTQPHFPDYPKTGVWPDAYYASFNLFNDAGTTGLGAELCAFDRSAMLTGAAATQQCFMATTSGEHTFLPATLDGATHPPAGEPEWFVSLATSGASALGYDKFHVDWATPGNSTLTAGADLPVNAFSEACSGGTCIPQNGTRTQLDSLGDRLMYRLAYRNFGDHEALVVDHSITAGSSVGVRWYELRPSSGNLTVFQQGTVAPDSSYRWMGSIAMDTVGDMALGYSVSSAASNPGIRYTGRLANDATGSMPQGEATVITGGGSQTSRLTRWGDYTEMTVDPGDDCTFWYVNQYEASSGSFNWHTRIGAFKFPGCIVPPSLSAAGPAQPGSTVTATWSGIANPTSTDWIGVYSSSGAACYPSLSSVYTTGRASGTVAVQIPATAAPGSTYQLRLFSNNSCNQLAVSNSFSVLQPVTLSASGSSQPGGTVTATWSGIANPTGTDWIGVYSSGSAACYPPLNSVYTTGAASGSVAVQIPATAAPGSTYQLRLFSNSTCNQLAVSNSFDVLQPVALSASDPAQPGSTVTATWSGVVNPTSTDWIGVYSSSGAACYPSLSSAYTTGTASGSVAVQIPTTAAAGSTYELRLFSNNSCNQLAVSNSFSVT